MDAPDLAITVGPQQLADSRSAPDAKLQPSGAVPGSRNPSETADKPLSTARIKTVPLTEEGSARLRERLLSEIDALTARRSSTPGPCDPGAKSGWYDIRASIDATRVG